ncbi:unnamed protein product [Ectocarpus sp. 8 AP-2014]
MLDKFGTYALSGRGALTYTPNTLRNCVPAPPPTAQGVWEPPQTVVLAFGRRLLCFHGRSKNPLRRRPHFVMKTPRSTPSSAKNSRRIPLCSYPRPILSKRRPLFVQTRIRDPGSIPTLAVKLGAH